MVEPNRQDREARIYICGVEPEDELLTEDQTMFIFCDAKANITTDIIDKSVEEDARHCVEQLNQQGKIAAVLYVEIVPGQSATFAVEIDGKLVRALAQIHSLALETGMIHDDLKKYPAQIIKLGDSKLEELKKEYEQSSSLISGALGSEDKVTVDEFVNEIENTAEAAISSDIPIVPEPEEKVTVDELVNEIENTAEVAMSSDIPRTPEPEVEVTVDEMVSRMETVAGIDTGTAKDHRRLALNHRLRDEWDNAIVEYTKAIELDDSFILAYFERGELFQRQGRKTDAIADFEKSMSLSQKEDLLVAAKQRIDELSK
jgi:tetratricopeptide (TPR) repeat protein